MSSLWPLRRRRPDPHQLPVRWHPLRRPLLAKPSPLLLLHRKPHPPSSGPHETFESCAAHDGTCAAAAPAPRAANAAQSAHRRTTARVSVYGRVDDSARTYVLPVHQLDGDVRHRVRLRAGGGRCIRGGSPARHGWCHDRRCGRPSCRCDRCRGNGGPRRRCRCATADGVAAGPSIQAASANAATAAIPTTTSARSGGGGGSWVVAGAGGRGAGRAQSLRPQRSRRRRLSHRSCAAPAMVGGVVAAAAVAARPADWLTDCLPGCLLSRAAPTSGPAASVTVVVAAVAVAATDAAARSHGSGRPTRPCQRARAIRGPSCSPVGSEGRCGDRGGSGSSSCGHDDRRRWPRAPRCGHWVVTGRPRRPERGAGGICAGDDCGDGHAGDRDGDQRLVRSRRRRLIVDVATITAPVSVSTTMVTTATTTTDRRSMLGWTPEGADRRSRSRRHRDASRAQTHCAQTHTHRAASAHASRVAFGRPSVRRPGRARPCCASPSARRHGRHTAWR